MKNKYKKITLVVLLLALSLGIFPACNSTPVKDDKVASAKKIIPKDKKTETVKPANDTAAKAKPTNQVPLTLTIKDLESPTAPVVVTFYNKKSTFLDPPHAFKRYRFTPSGKTLTATIDDLKYGEYAFVTFQDVDGNGEFEKNKIGIPKEPFAFSNNFEPTVRAPEFSNCRFTYSKSKNTMAVTMMSK